MHLSESRVRAVHSILIGVNTGYREWCTHCPQRHRLPGAAPSPMVTPKVRAPFVKRRDGTRTFSPLPLGPPLALGWPSSMVFEACSMLVACLHLTTVCLWPCFDALQPRPMSLRAAVMQLATTRQLNVPSLASGLHPAHAVDS